MSYDSLLPLLAPLPYNLVPYAIAAGVADGRAYADDAAVPRAALVWDGGGDVFVTGDPQAPGAQPALARAFSEDILPRAAAWHWVGFAIFPSPAWAMADVEALLPGKRLVPARRYLYTQAAAAPTAGLPDGFEMATVDGAFMARTDLLQADSLRQWLEDCWLSADAFAAHGFGACVLEGDTVVSWCMAEYVSGGRCGIGIETTEGYRRRGFATAAAAHYLRLAAERGLKPHWECWASNAASVATAEKAGFAGRVDYGVYWVPLA